MPSMKIEQTQFPDLAWLADVREVCRPLTESRPIWVRHESIASGPSVPHPERHPYCELNLILHGNALHYCQRGQSHRRSGDLFLAGPGAPHYSRIDRYPLETITVYFLPSLLLEMGPAGDGCQLLQRIASVNEPDDQFIRPQLGLRRHLVAGLRNMIVEFSRPSLGSEVKLRAVLGDLLVDLVRSQTPEGAAAAGSPRAANWVFAERALRYLRENYADRVYAREVAAATGVSESGLRKLFRDCVGLPWVQYLQGYRIHRAAALLMEPGRSVTDAALAVGFEDLSHFNAAFRSFMGVSPGTYAKQRMVAIDRSSPAD